MLDIDYNKFSDYFYTNIVQQLKPFEQKRKNLLLTIALIIGVSIGIVIILITNMSSTMKVTDVIDCGSQLLIFLVAIVIMICGFFINRYKKGLKKALYVEIFRSLGLNYSNNDQDLDNAGFSIRDICFKSDIFNRYDNIDADDIISGKYKELPFKIVDNRIWYVTGSGKNRHEVTVFEGLFLATRINKKFNCETLIKTEGFFKAKTIGKKVAIHLEDPVFEKQFEVYSDDQIESRYILTTAFINRLLKYKQKKRCKIEVFFSNNASPVNNVFFFMNTNKDNFEIPVFKKIINKDLFYNILQELREILDIIDDLKLEQNIGM